MVDKYIKYVLALASVFLIAYLLFVAFVKEVGATWIPQCEEDVVIVDEPVDEPEECTENCEEEEPPVEEEPVDEPVVPEVKSTPDRAKFAVSQGPNGSLGDGKLQIEWKKFDGSKRVEIAVAKDCVFGNGYWSKKTGDDGAYNLLLDGPACVKIRGVDDKTDWSKVRHVTP